MALFATPADTPQARSQLSFHRKTRWSEILVASGILIGGIAFTGDAIRPPFEDDPQAVARELKRMVEGGAKRFHMGHGGPLAAAEVMRHAQSLANITQSASTACHCAHPAH